MLDHLGSPAATPLNAVYAILVLALATCTLDALRKHRASRGLDVARRRLRATSYREDSLGYLTDTVPMARRTPFWSRPFHALFGPRRDRLPRIDRQAFGRELRRGD